MTIRKKYISTEASPLSVDILTDNGAFRSFDFTGGLKHPVIRMPHIVLIDEADQKLLESHVSFGKSFILEEKPKLQEPTPSNKEVKESDEVLITEKVLPRVTDGKNWLNEEHGVSFSKLQNKASVIKETPNFINLKVL